MGELRLVGFDMRHVAVRVSWLNDARVREGVPVAGPITEESTFAWAGRVRSDMTRADFVLEDARGQALVMCGITNIDEESSRGELYMFGDPDAHGQGHGTRALQELCRWAFDERDLNRIFLFTVEHNAGARRFYERVGFRLEGQLRQHQWFAGRLVDRYIHGLLAADWRAGSNG